MTLRSYFLRSVLQEAWDHFKGLQTTTKTTLVFHLFAIYICNLEEGMCEVILQEQLMEPA